MIRYGLYSSSLVFRHFDGGDLSVVFDPRSGDTHLLDAVSFETCQVLVSGPATVDQIKRSMLVEFTAEDPAMICQAVDAAIERLRYSGLLGSVSN
ncbi:HPr-rel-A system PqqD family peptide chaperone [Rhodocyclus tenuis]|uniref:PqqD family protein of HPr-rel-A system n=1 Tax=Rhodocyclus tenuis TaxID=1066 RepID=A0A840GJ36_RHOTE|nr:HPr-rel-A system PqqD family peptide chaperone [Rhodocyclus tenuis]MBB4248189.1 PqqD family protein of HPr-rel-A system [Rhodocyclus tenuis]